MFLNRKLNTSGSPRTSRSFVVPPPPADEPQPDSPGSNSSSFFESRGEIAMPLSNPWPPTPPHMSPYSSTPAVNDLSWSQEELISSAVCVSCSLDLNDFFVLNHLLSPGGPLIEMTIGSSEHTASPRKRHGCTS